MLADLAGAVRRGDLDPRTLVEESLRRIEASQQDLNAVVGLRAEDALEEAVRSPRTGVLAGLPVLVKDLSRCRGMRTTMGSRLFAEAPVDQEDDVEIARLRAAGAIVLGRTNTPAFGHAALTTNEVFGTTSNPWNTDRSPGGSSGGSAAALAAALVPLATASDGGGSARIPASCSGLVGYKPTMGTIGRDTVPNWMGFSTAGVMGTTVADVVLEAKVIAGPAPGDVLCLPDGSVRIEPEPSGRVLACRSFRDYVDPSIEAAFYEAIGQLSKDGLVVERVAPPFDASLARAWSTISAAELGASLIEYREQWDIFEPSLRAHLEASTHISTLDYLAAQRRRYEDAGRLDHLLGRDGVLIVPTVNIQSWPAAGPFPLGVEGVTDDPYVSLNTPELNFTTHPAVTVPLGLDDAGVPFGLQIIAPRFQDGMAFELAARVERLRPWPLHAPGYAPYPHG